MKQLTATIGIVGPCRLSYLQVFKPRRNDMRGEDEYSCTLLIPKVATQQCAEPKAIIDGVAAMVKAAAEEKFGVGAKGWTRPLQDGDAVLNTSDEPKHPGYWFLPIRCSADASPVLIDGQREPAAAADGWVSGHWGCAKVKFFAYDRGGKKGVAGWLCGVQFLYRDEPFGSAHDPASVAAEFDVVASADQGGAYDPFGEE